jgi:carboxypeptidase C (cathepsin A)
MSQKDETGKAKADMFFIAYTLERDVVNPSPAQPPASSSSQPSTQSTTQPSTRPITFIFNGGPGAASVWLHLGTAGPKRINIDEAGVPSAPPFHLVNNEATWLDASDLVFIDPVGTGYSRPAKDEKGEQFYGVKEDVESVGAFIRLYITRNDRWSSPKFLAGESYGTTRAAGLSEHLLERHGISLNGIVLISSVLNFQTIATNGPNELPYPLFLPSYAATAWYHKKLPADLQKDLDVTLREVEQFAIGDYAAALMKGDALTEQGRRAIAQKLARYTGLSADYIIKSKLKIDPERFRKQLLADEGKILGRFDARITGFAYDQAASETEYDPSLSQFLPLYSAGFNAYVRDDLHFESDLPYEVLSGKVHPWNFGKTGNGFLDVGDTLAMTILKNPQLKVLFASGQMDLATPYLSADYTITHLGLPPPLRKQISHTYYPAGHMLYHDPASRQKLHDDIARFIQAAIP